MCMICTMYEAQKLNKTEAVSALKEAIISDAHRKEVYNKIGIARAMTSVEVAGINTADAPDFVDAYIAYAEWADTGEPLTDSELEEIPSDVIYSYVMDFLY